MMSIRLFDRLGLVLMVLALLVPLGLAIAESVPDRPELRWAEFGFFRPSDRMLGIDPLAYGFRVILWNQGDAPTGDIEIDVGFRIDHTPSDVQPLFGFLDWSLEEVGRARRIHLESLDPGERADFIIYGGPEMVDEVRAGGEVVPESQLRPLSFVPDREPWLPNRWTLGGVLLLAGLAVQNLALRRRRS